MERFVRELFEAYFEPQLMAEYFKPGEKIVTPYKFSRVERFILIYLLWEGPQTMGHISAKFHLPNSTTNQTVTRLSQRGLLEIAQSSTDKRSRIVSLSPQGELVTNRLLSAFQQHIARFFGIIANKMGDSLTDEERNLLKSINQKLKDL